MTLAKGEALSTKSVKPEQHFTEPPPRYSEASLVKKLEEFHERCGVGVVDFGFQQPGISHQEVMRELELFGKEVLPQMHAF